MQVLKEEIKNGILEAAQAEFLRNGFERASVRAVAAGACTSKSNVYNYFKDKDHLFRAVVQPALSAMENGFAEIARANRGRRAGAYTMEAQRAHIALFMRYSGRFNIELQLLFFRSDGSSLAGFRDEVTAALSGLLGEWAAAEAPGKAPSEFFVRSVAGFYVDTIARAVAEGAGRDEAAPLLDAFLKFVYGGWKAVLQ